MVTQAPDGLTFVETISDAPPLDGRPPVEKETSDQGCTRAHKAGNSQIAEKGCPAGRMAIWLPSDLSFHSQQAEGARHAPEGWWAAYRPFRSTVRRRGAPPVARKLSEWLARPAVCRDRMRRMQLAAWAAGKQGSFMRDARIFVPLPYASMADLGIAGCTCAHTLVDQEKVGQYCVARPTRHGQRVYDVQGCCGVL